MIPKIPIKRDTTLLIQLIDGKTGKKCPAFVITPGKLVEIFDSEGLPEELDLPTTYVDVLSNVDQVNNLSDEEKMTTPITDLILSYPMFSAATFRDFFKPLEEKEDGEASQSAE